MSVDLWIIIIWIIMILLSGIILTFLTAIDVLDDNVGIGIWISISIPIIGIAVIFGFGVALFYDFCEKHKDKIRKFLKIKD